MHIYLRQKTFTQISGYCQRQNESHIITLAHHHIITSSHQHIITSPHQQIITSTHQQIITSTNPPPFQHPKQFHTFAVYLLARHTRSIKAKEHEQNNIIIRYKIPYNSRWNGLGQWLEISLGS